MLNAGTFFGLIAVALAANISIDNQTQSIATEKLRVSNSTDVSFNPPEGDKGIWEWLGSIIGFTGQETTDGGQGSYPPECTSQCKCGLTNKHNRIVGGVETKENQYPWMAELRNQGRFYCGASVIADRYVLTAAHCADGFNKKLLIVRLLEHDRNNSSGGKTQDFEVQQIIKHNGYSTANYNNDIALLKLKTAIKFDGTLRPVCLPELTKTFAGEKGIVTGWGAIGESGPISNKLREVTVPILSNTQCRASKYPARRITDNMLCAGYLEGGKDSCQGDSGGPLHVVDGAIHRIVGVVSWGEGCAAPDYPGVYCRVNRFVTWIQRNTKDACYC